STTALSIPTPARSRSASIFGCDFHGSSPMRLRRLLPSLLASATLLGCANLDLTDPNEPSTDTFWRTAADAMAGVNAVYNGLQNNGTYGRWLVFASDLRSDVGLINSPWTALSNFTKFTFTSYDFEVNHHLGRGDGAARQGAFATARGDRGGGGVQRSDRLRSLRPDGELRGQFHRPVREQRGVGVRGAVRRPVVPERGDARTQHLAHGGTVRPELLRRPADALVFPAVPAGHDGHRPARPA